MLGLSVKLFFVSTTHPVSSSLEGGSAWTCEHQPAMPSHGLNDVQGIRFSWDFSSDDVEVVGVVVLLFATSVSIQVQLRPFRILLLRAILNAEELVDPTKIMQWSCKCEENFRGIPNGWVRRLREVLAAARWAHKDVPCTSSTSSTCYSILTVCLQYP